MFRSWGTWLGIEGENDQVNRENDAVENQKVTAVAESEQTAAGEEKRASTPQLVEKAKDFSGFIYTFASTASKKLSESVVETAQTLKKSVEEGRINGIIDKTILGDFKKEQEKFVQGKKAKQMSSAVPPWVGYNDEDTIQQQILALSADKRNFLRDPPAGVQFHFDFGQMYPVAMVMLEEDELLRKMRFHLVPKQVKEEAFWKNYFYRVSLIKQSAQLTALAAERKSAEKICPGHEEAHQMEVDKLKTSRATCQLKSESNQDEEGLSNSPLGAEFVSDAFGSCKLNEGYLLKEMKQLVLDKRDPSSQQQEETPDWERELQEELQEYDVLADDDNHDEGWDQEIEDMLKEDCEGT